MTNNLFATRKLWSAVAQNEPNTLRALVKQGADVQTQSETRVVNNRGQTGKDSLIDHALVHKSGEALDTLLELGARFHPTSSRGSEFTRACATATPWMEGIKRMFTARTSLQAVAHRDKEGWAAIHNALGGSTPQGSELVTLLLTRPGKWLATDTAIAVGLCINKQFDLTVLDQIENAGVPVREHLVDTKGADRLWAETNRSNLMTVQGRAWLNALLDRNVACPSANGDVQMLAFLRQVKAERQMPKSVVTSPRSRARP
jgi:hypothetical protein